MTVYFADTSAFAKRYISEIGSGWVRTWITSSSGNTIIISSISTVEFISLLERRRKEGEVTLTAFSQLKAGFLVHARRQYKQIQMSQQVIRLAQSYAERHGLRALDSLQLAAAMAAAQRLSLIPTFVTADQRLFAAAAAEGFPVEDPNAHP